MINFTLSKTQPNQKQVKSKQLAPFKIKKRESNYENEVIKETRILNFLPKTYGDRFVPRRYLDPQSDLMKEYIHTKWLHKNPQEFMDIIDVQHNDGYWRWSNFKQEINDCFESQSRDRLLMFHDWITQNKCPQQMNSLKTISAYREIKRNVKGLDWLCVPRPRPVAFVDTTHDLPNFRRISHLNIMSWASSGKIAASFGLDLVIWAPDQDKTVIYRMQHISALEYDRTGMFLAVARKAPRSPPELHIWNIEPRIISSKESHKYPVLFPQITCITWHPSNIYLVCGTKLGHLVAYKRDKLILIHNVRHSSSRITSTKFSISGKFLATCALAGQILIYLWNGLIPHLAIYDRGQCFITWHPWSEDDLFIASKSPARIRLANISTRSALAYYRRTDKKCQINGITINKLSGELVVSCKILENAVPRHDILILGSMSRVVDILSCHEQDVSFMMWSPDGTQLATAGDDDTMHIWNFFAYNKDYLQKTKKIVGKTEAPAIKRENNILRSNLYTIR